VTDRLDESCGDCQLTELSAVRQVLCCALLLLLLVCTSLEGGLPLRRGAITGESCEECRLLAAGHLRCRAPHRVHRRA